MLIGHAELVPAFLALFIGLYYVAAAIGGLASPGQWARMIEELERSPYGQLIGGILALGIGLLLIAVVPPQGDWLNLLLFLLGCVATIKGFFVLALPGRLFHLSRPLLAGSARPYAFIILTVGLLLCGLALVRLI